MKKFKLTRPALPEKPSKTYFKTYEFDMFSQTYSLTHIVKELCSMIVKDGYTDVSPSSLMESIEIEHNVEWGSSNCLARAKIEIPNQNYEKELSKYYADVKNYPEKLEQYKASVRADIQGQIDILKESMDNIDKEE